MYTHYARIECCVTATVTAHILNPISYGGFTLWFTRSSDSLSLSRPSCFAIVLWWFMLFLLARLSSVTYAIQFFLLVLDLYDFQFANERYGFSLPSQSTDREGSLYFFRSFRNLNMAYESKVSRPDEIKWSGQTLFSLIYSVNMCSQTKHKLNCKIERSFDPVNSNRCIADSQWLHVSSVRVMFDWSLRELWCGATQSIAWKSFLLWLLKLQ